MAGPKHLLIEDQFFKGAQSLRKVFQERFAEPRLGSRERFVWDYWHVPRQYTLVRTPAQNFFPETIYKQFLLRILQWGERELGCRAISPPWLSFYVDGCEQELHAHIPHGPWSFVYSLTHWSQREFKGGETVIAKPKLLEYWKSLAPSDYHEHSDFFTEVPARFNRLVVFDPRLPHGVRRVSGVQDPRRARLVIHGWFTQPQPYVDGPLDAAKLSRVLEPWEDGLRHEARRQRAQGVLTLRFKVQGGRLAGLKILSNTLVGAPSASWLKKSLGILSTLEFPKDRQASSVTLPLYLS